MKQKQSNVNLSEKPIIKLSTRTLKHEIWDTFLKLKRKEEEPVAALALSKLADTICKITYLEINASRHLMDTDSLIDKSMFLNITDSQPIEISKNEPNI